MKSLFVRIALLLFATLAIAVPALAHGKNINIDIKTSVPDADKPMTKLYRAMLSYDDGDKVNDARLILLASRPEESESVGPVLFNKTNEAGVFQTTLTYPAYGEWTLLFRVTGPGEGEATLSESLTAPTPARNSSSTARVSITLAFDNGDALNLGARTIHILAAISWFTIVALLFVGARVVSPEAWADTLSRFSRSLPIILAATWALLIVTGIYLALNNVPNRAPGVFAPDLLARLPWGREYFVAFVVKMLMVIGGIAVGLSIGYVMRHSNGLTSERISQLVTLDLILGLFIFVDVVVIGYFHNLSHLGLLI